MGGALDRRLNGHAARESQLSEAYGKARYAVAQFELAVREDQLKPTRPNRQRVIAALSALRATLPAIDRNGDARDRALTAELRRQIGATTIGVGHLMAAAEEFDAVRRRTGSTGSRWHRTSTGSRATVNAAAAAHRAGLSAGLSSARRSQDVALGATFVMFVLGLLLTGAVVAVLRFKRRLDDARRAEIERLRDAATRDSLTGLANHRAFHECLDGLVETGSRFSLAIVDLDGLKLTNDTCGHQAGDELLERLAHALADVSPDGRAFRIGGDEFAMVVDGTAVDAFGVAQDLRMHVAGATTGVAELRAGEDKHGLIRRADLALLAAKRTHREVLVYSADMESMAGTDLPPDERHLSTLATALARAVDAKDSYTRSHCETVAELCVLIAGELGLDTDRVARIRIAGLLHDVGKIGISDAILQKPAALTAEEAAIMRTHPDLGAHIVSAAELYEEAGWILHHHERLDGRGYPDGLTGGDVPLESRIIMVADAFEAMTSDRPYRPRRPVDEALAELERHSGTQFDPECIAALRRILLPAATPGRPALSAAA